MPVQLYLDRGTWLHRLHPVVRLVGMVAIFVAAYLGERPASQLPLALLVAVLLAVTGSLPNVHRLRYLFLLVFVMTLVIWTLFYGPDGAPPLVEHGWFLISRTAPWFALAMALKLNVFLASGILFLSTTRIEEFSYALGRLGVPYKVGFTMTMAFRLVPVFLDSAFTVVQAQRCRGLDFEEGGLWRRLGRYAPVIIPVFMGALRRADGMAMALEVRGFQANRRRTMLQRYPFGVADAGALALGCALALLYVALAWRGVLAIG